MPYNGSGTYSLPAGSVVADGTQIDAADHNTPVQDIETALSAVILRNGVAAFSGNQSMGSNKLTNLAAATTAADAPRLDQVQTSAAAHAASVGGTVDAITLTFSPVFTAYTSKMRFRWTSGGANTSTTPNATLDGLGAKTIKKGAGSALAVGDTGAAGYICEAVYNGTDIILLNPALAAASDTAAGIVELATATETLTGTDTGRAVTPDGLAALWEKGSDTASAGTTTIAEGGYLHITGTTTITDIDFSTAKDGRGVKVVFDGALTLTHNATTLILPGGANITTAAGDTAEFIQDSSDNIKCLWYQRANAAPPSNPWVDVFKTSDTTRNSTTTLTADPDLTFTPAANTNYAFEFEIFYTTATAADFKFGIDGPSTPTLFRASVRAIPPDNGGSFNAGAELQMKLAAYETTGQSLTAASATDGYIQIIGIIQNGSNSSALAFTWAQNTSNAGDTTVHVGSRLRYRKVS
jgi:hypothetical protein